MRVKSFLPVLILATGCIVSACNGGGSSGVSNTHMNTTNNAGDGQLSQTLVQTASLELNSQGMRDISQGCADSGTSSSSNAPVTTQPSGFVAAFQEDGAFALKTASGQQVLGGAWRQLNANRVELSIDGSAIQLDVAVNGNSLITSCVPSATTSDDNVPVSGTPVRTLVGTAPTAGSGTNNPTSGTSTTSSSSTTSIPGSSGTTIPAESNEWVGTGEVSPTGCPSYVYLRGPGTYGAFSGNDGYPAFKLVPEASSADGTSCSYSRPTDSPSWAEFVAARFPAGSTCTPHGTDFQCVGATPEIVACPESIAIGPITYVSYGDYGSSRLLPVPTTWHAENDSQTLRRHIEGDIWNHYGSEGTPAMRCKYSDYSVVRLTR